MILGALRLSAALPRRAALIQRSEMDCDLTRCASYREVRASSVMDTLPSVLLQRSPTQFRTSSSAACASQVNEEIRLRKSHYNVAASGLKQTSIDATFR